jgi:hypothetical protein
VEEDEMERGEGVREEDLIGESAAFEPFPFFPFLTSFFFFSLISYSSTPYPFNTTTDCTHRILLKTT